MLTVDNNLSTNTRKNGNIEHLRYLAKKAKTKLGDRFPEVPKHPAYNDFQLFKRLIYPRFREADHITLLDWHLMAIARFAETRGEEGIGRLIVIMPPRHSKTLNVSKLFTSWYLGRNPWHRMILVSYGQSLANKNSRVARNFINSPIYQKIFPKVRLADGVKSVMEWSIEGTDDEGGVDALGIGGAATGKGANILGVDDPFKNREQAESKVYRDKIYDSFNDDLYTRLAPGGAVIVTHTRWHEDDLAGRLMKEDPDKWTVLRLSALAEENDVLGREPGAALWPGWFPVETLNETRGKLGPYSWNALYQGRPQPAEGGIFKHSWFYPELRFIPPLVRIVRFWDLAMSSKSSADYTAGVKMGVDRDGNYYILDVARAQVELGELPRFLADVMIADGVDVRQGFEANGYMTRAIQELVKRPMLRAHAIKGYKADTDKLTRALPFASRCALDLVRMSYARWNKDYTDEMKSFPNGAHDDMVDATSGAYMMLSEPERKAPTATTVRTI